MQCCDTGSQQAIRIELPVDLARDISYLINSVRALGGTGRITLDMQGGNVTSTEITVRRPRGTRKTA